MKHGGFMYKVLFALLLCFNAQAFDKLRAGGNFGLTFPSIESSGQDSALEVYELAVGAGFGASSEAVINDKISLLFDISHITYYTEFYYTTDPLIYGEAVFRYLFLKPAVLFKANEVFGLFAGLSYGFNLLSEATYNGTVTDYNDSVDYTANNRLSLDLGVALTIELNNIYLRPRIAYQIAMNPAVESTTTDYEAKFNAFMINVDLLFDMN